MEYTREARQLFDKMKASVRQEVSDLVLRLEIGKPAEAAESAAQAPAPNRTRLSAPAPIRVSRLLTEHLLALDARHQGAAGR